MQSTLTFVTAAVLLAAAAYAQWAVPRLTRGAVNGWALRLLLVLLGAAVGLSLAQLNGNGTGTFALFVLGFGLVHVPPALVLLLKRLRGESPS